jgi:small-conductance mechanosensitive channel
MAKGPMDDLYADDFFPHFKNPEDAKAAFLLIDRDGNGDISRQEMKDFVLETYNNRQHLEKSMRSSSQAIGKLDSIFKTIAGIIILFISSSVWKIDTTKFLTSLISIWAGLIFAFGGVLKNMVEACIFLFITHPYDVGDRVEIDGIAYFVVEFGITTTILKKWDGREIYGISPL